MLENESKIQNLLIFIFLTMPTSFFRSISPLLLISSSIYDTVALCVCSQYGPELFFGKQLSNKIRIALTTRLSFRPSGFTRAMQNVLFMVIKVTLSEKSQTTF
jgi:hypothetical protein